MAHEIQSNDQMVWTGETPWHGLGVELPDLVTAVAACSLAMPWLVDLHPLQAVLPDGTKIEVPNQFASVRSDDHTILGVVGSDYEPIQNSSVAELADTLINQSNGRCETAGSLFGGRKVWFCLELPGDVTIKGDPSPTKRYLLVTSSHDGKSALKCLITAVRVVCNNTLTLALRGAKNEIVIHHTAKAEQRIREAKQALQAADTFYSRYVELGNALADKPFTAAQMDQLAETLFPSKAKPSAAAAALGITDQAALDLVLAETRKVLGAGNNQSALADVLSETISRARAMDALLSVPKQTRDKREKLSGLFEAGVGIEGAIRGTAYAALQAATEYADHHATYRETYDGRKLNVAESRMTSVLWDAGARFKSKALDKILELVDLPKAV